MSIEKYKLQLDILRKEFPIGIRQGLLILKEVEGDIQKARKLFQQKSIEVILQKVDINHDMALQNLIENNFSMPETLESINNKRFTLTERILRKNKNNKLKALSRIALAIEDVEKLERNFWLSFSELDKLNRLGSISEKVICFMVVNEWLDYVEWESFDSAVYFHLEYVIYQIETYLSLPVLVSILNNAKENSSNINEISQIEAKFELEKPLLISALYNFVESNIEYFPK
ncbi:hypothetical protein WAF17_15080 [Bernardetia sp. ABR2-2B]|uniref:hypothetical protein n=1 Tax=Bernardetia sp. ABR2-2B TaxID=3127472 RepID=UPI0030D56FB7